jgi:recombinational DNA repair protein RecT
MSYNENIKIEAADLASALDNPASVMIRRLLEVINQLNRTNELWSTRHWQLMHENTVLKEKLKQWEEDMPELDDEVCTCDDIEHERHSCPFSKDVHGEDIECSCCPYCYNNCVESI